MNLSIFDVMYPKYKIAKPIRLIELFGGYGSQALALKYLGLEFEHWKLVEWAVKSIQAYKDIHFTDEEEIDIGATKEQLIECLYKFGISANYNEPMTKEQISRLSEKQLKIIWSNIYQTHNLVNIQQVKGKDLEIVDTDKYEYIMTYSFPCQDLSLAGKGKGMSDTSTRSGMLWEVERILTECKELGTMPQVLLMENVPQVHSLDNMPDFHKWQVRLEELGYHSYWQDLIATDYGIPQTRNRCFMVSILGDYSYAFPQPIPLKLRLKDMSEDNVDGKYYLSDELVKHIQKTAEEHEEYTQYERYNGDLEMWCRVWKDKSPTLNTKCQDTKIYANDTEVETCLLKNKGKEISRFTDNANTLMARDYKGFGNQEMNAVLTIKNATKQGYLEATEGDGIDISSRMEYHRGNVQKDKIQTLTTSGGNDRGVVTIGNYSPSNHNASRIVDKEYCSPTVMENHGTITATQTSDLRIRKLTPRECGRLMNVKDEDITNMLRNQSDSSAFHLFGDSICTNVLMAIFGELLDIDWKTKLNELLNSKGE